MFKKKELIFSKKCLVGGPQYLNGNFKDIPNALLNRFRILEDDYTWTRQLITPNGSTKFKIQYFGDKVGELITSKGELPPIVNAINTETDDKVLLFDGAKHGYNAVFWQEFPVQISERVAHEPIEINNESEFEIIVLARYSAHIKEQFEEDFDRDGHVVNAREEKLGSEAFLNGYDSIQLFVFGSEGRGVEILSEETA